MLRQSKFEKLFKLIMEQCNNFKSPTEIIAETNTPKVWDGPVSSTSVFNKTKQDEENPLCGKTYAQLKDIAKNISKNKMQDSGSTCTCPICKKSFKKGSSLQAFCEPTSEKSKRTRSGYTLLKRTCPIIWNDTLRSLNKQYPDDKGQAVEYLKGISK